MRAPYSFNLQFIKAVVRPWYGRAQLLSTIRSLSFPRQNCAKIMGRPFHGQIDRIDSLFAEVFLAREYEVFDLPECPVIVDCGANIGMSVLYFKTIRPASTIVACEPNPQAFQLLKQNVGGLDGITLRNVALTDQAGEAELFCSDDQAALTDSLRPDRGIGPPILVKTERLSELLGTLPSIDLVKIDVEGAEWEIISDLRETGLLTKPNRYIIEYHHQIGNEEPRLSKFLCVFEDAGFSYLLSAGRRSRGRFQDIMVLFQR
jgi:FkbM family methyltransferase